MKTIDNNSHFEMIINKSKFISYAYKIDDEPMAKNIINELRIKHTNATHYCYAYVTGNIKRMSDDGEPSHTAGMPILSVLESKELNNVLIVVIRYFGGVKLGTGGLVKAYTNAAIEVLKTCKIKQEVKTTSVRITFPYDKIKEVDYALKACKITYKEFDSKVIYEFECEEDNYPKKLDSLITSKKKV